MSKANLIDVFVSPELNRDLNLLSNFYFELAQHKKPEFTEMIMFVKKYHILEKAE